MELLAVWLLAVYALMIMLVWSRVSVARSALAPVAFVVRGEPLAQVGRTFGNR